VAPNLVLEDLTKARVYEFAFVMQPLKLRGATGSTVAPTATAERTWKFMGSKS
jgi:hypothetical protein